jgi:hypothetical protein
MILTKILNSSSTEYYASTTERIDCTIKYKDQLSNPNLYVKTSNSYTKRLSTEFSMSCGYEHKSYTLTRIRLRIIINSSKNISITMGIYK